VKSNFNPMVSHPSCSFLRASKISVALESFIPPYGEFPGGFSAMISVVEPGPKLNLRLSFAFGFFSDPDRLESAFDCFGGGVTNPLATFFNCFGFGDRPRGADLLL
jgi:hypothetical protein